MLRRVALVRTNVAEKLSTSFIRVTRIGELGTTLAVTRNRRLVASTRFQLLSSFVIKLTLWWDMKKINVYGCICSGINILDIMPI
jgi:hypothetical protein